MASVRSILGAALHASLGSAMAAAGLGLTPYVDYTDVVSNGVLSSIAGFTRAGVGTYFNAAGVLQTAGAGVQRLDYDPGTLALKGLLIESARTNLLLHNRDLSNLAWTKTGMTAALTQTGIDGVVNSATVLTATAINGTVLQAVTSAAAQRATSLYIKRVTGVGAVDVTQDGGTTWTPVTVTAGWTRVGPATASVLNPSVGVRLAVSTDAVAVDFVQLEDGFFATSPIATGATAMTRLADQFTVSGAAFNEMYREPGVSIYADLGLRAAQAMEYLVLDNGTASEQIGLYNAASAGSTGLVVDNAVTQAQVTSVDAGHGASVSRKVALAAALNDVVLCQSNGTQVTDLTATLPTCTQLRTSTGNLMGSPGMNGWYKNLRIYKRRVTNTELQALTV